ncbi:vacuolar ATPase assembly integral membrane protein VMA21 homolog [Pseudomyrmex gracilis]|uniref:vacuolar ATPase assembly integral membrane protein VMA21 homolog n=1 Tax=Pseudomyrmex gracilis TaxID=219809 RepID=UPI000994D146|nr:vacuolar ATPase assembly integral membrane protein VMA21 homolog [Pseudomyrmex gracilis]
MTSKSSKLHSPPSTKERMEEKEIFIRVVFHGLLIFGLPVITFFLSKAYLSDGIFGLTDMQSKVYSAGVAVLVLHIAFGHFIFRVFFDERTPALKRD